jgi:hypothetical protein
MICWVVEKIGGEAPTIFSVMEKTLSEEKKIAFAFETIFLVPKTIVSMKKTIVSIAKNIVSTAVKTVSEARNAVCASSTIVLMAKTIVEDTKMIVFNAKKIVVIEKWANFRLCRSFLSLRRSYRYSGSIFPYRRNDREKLFPSS